MWFSGLKVKSMNSTDTSETTYRANNLKPMTPQVATKFVKENYYCGGYGSVQD
jgi:hypothetical protein